MAHIDPHRINDLAARRIARVAQITALPPQPMRTKQTLWQINRRGWMHSFRGPRQVGSLGPETQAAQIARLMLQRRGIAGDVALQIGEELAGIPTSEWTIELLRDILPPDQEEVIPEILSAATVPAGLTALQWAQLTSPLGGLGEPGALIAGGVASVQFTENTTLLNGARRTNSRQSLVPAPAHLGALTAVYQATNQGDTGTLWIALPQLGWRIDSHPSSGAGAGIHINWPLEIDIDAPIAIEIGYDIINNTGFDQTGTLEIKAALSYTPISG